MTTALAYIPQNPLVDLLDEQFSESALDSLLELEGETIPWKLWNEALYGPLREFLSRPGKEFRARLVDAAWRLSGQTDAPPRELPLLVEILHAGSLIVDDIEDGSAYRRGRPALHCQYGVPLALNAGNWLYFWPQALLRRLGLSDQKELALHRLVTNTLMQCHQGQALDLSVRIGELAQRDIPRVVSMTTRLKTGSLMQLAASVGAIAAGAQPEHCQAIARFGQRLGSCLQMLDDIGGITSDRRCHKGHEDLLLGRPTWPWAWLATDLDEVSFAKLANMGREVVAHDLHPEYLAEEMKERIGVAGKARAHAHLCTAVGELTEVVGKNPVLCSIEADVRRLEKSYE